MEKMPDTPQKHFANRVTPLSKSLALVLFVTLPILTLYIGYKNGAGESMSEHTIPDGVTSSDTSSPRAENPGEEFIRIEKEEYSVSMPKGYFFSNRRQENGLIVDYYANAENDEIVLAISELSDVFVEIDSVRALIQNPYNTKAQAAYGRQSTYDLADPSYKYEYANDRAVLVYAGGIVHEIIGGSSSNPILYNFTSAGHPEYLKEIVGSFIVK